MPVKTSWPTTTSLVESCLTVAIVELRTLMMGVVARDVGHAMRAKHATVNIGKIIA
jgi:hypothetical protein